MIAKLTMTILFASLIAVTVLPFSMAHSAEAESTPRYADLFPNSNTSEVVKQQIMESLQIEPSEEMEVPNGQEELAERILVLLDVRNSATNDETKELVNNLIASLENDMLEVGIVLVENYEKNPEEWKRKLASHMESDARYNEPTTRSQTSDFLSSFYYKYWCYNDLLVCTSSTTSQYMNHGSLWSTQKTVHSSSSGGFLAPYHKVKFIGTGSDLGVSIESWFSEKQGSTWVANCYDENTWNFPYSGKTHYWTICTTSHGDPGNKLYSSIYIN